MATVGGNICQSFAAAAMVSLCAALDAVALIWRPDGSEYAVPVAALITGNGTNALGPGEVLRAVDIPGACVAGAHRIPQDRTGQPGPVRRGAHRPGRRGRQAVFTITAATLRPVVLRYPELPDAATLRADVDCADGYYTDPLGAADWRRQVSGVLLEEIRQELAA